MAKARDNNHQLCEVTREVFERRAKRRLHDEDVREISRNLCGFFAVLREWTKAEASAQASSKGEARPSGE